MVFSSPRMTELIILTNPADRRILSASEPADFDDNTHEWPSAVPRALRPLFDQILALPDGDIPVDVLFQVRLAGTETVPGLLLLLTGTMQHAHFPSHIGANAARLILTVLPPHGLLMLLAHSLHVAEVQNLPDVWPKRVPRLKDILLRACDDSDDESRGAVLAFLQLLRARDPRISAYRQRLTVTHEPTQGRNELCRCGSGKKFKRCCLLH